MHERGLRFRLVNLFKYFYVKFAMSFSPGIKSRTACENRLDKQ